MLRVFKLIRHMSKEGHDFYDSKEAKELFAKQLVSLSEKSFWAGIAPLFGAFISDTVDVNLIVISICVFFLTGIYLRHQGLRIIDEIYTGKIEIK